MTPSIIVGFFLATTCSCAVSLAVAQSNGMVMSMDVPMDLQVGRALPYVHFTPGDTVWFLGWVPSGRGTMVGTCVGVFLLAMLERWVAAVLAVLEGRREVRGKTEAGACEEPAGGKRSHATRTPSFDLTRGVVFAAHAFLKTLLMLVVMTFQLAFILSIVGGSGVGEMLFGRMAMAMAMSPRLD